MKPLSHGCVESSEDLKLAKINVFESLPTKPKILGNIADEKLFILYFQ